MSLTNPKDVVTEERLSEFYGQILPYLGGMPEALANKFSKSDLYSTDEKIVGCWTDGRPIYQKTVTGVTASGASPSSIKDTLVSIGAQLDWCMVTNFMLKTSSGAILPFNTTTLELNIEAAATLGIVVYPMCNSASSDANKLRVRNSVTAWCGCTFYATVQYTKTTDAANSFKYGNETDYSTDEKIVGTWIDGKPLYQKTVNVGAMGNGATTPWNVNFNHGISNMSKVTDCNGVAINSSGTCRPLCYANPNDTKIAGIVASTSSIYIVTNENFSGYTAYVTLKYTKTTD